MICLRIAILPAMIALVATGFAAESKAAKAPAPVPGAAVVETEIKAVGDATFDAGNHVATFLGGVTVNDPRFTMTSQKLTVYLVKKRDPNTADDSTTGGIERAVAEGNVEIIQKPPPPSKTGEAPERVSGKSEKATFEPKTGVVVLTGSPIVHRGVNEHIATSPSTVMTLTRDGGLRTNGPSKTIIRDTSKANDLTSSPTKKP